MRLLRIQAWLVCLSWVFAAPSGGTETESGNHYFETHIRPLLLSRCTSCHSAGKQEGGLSLDRRAGWSEGGSRGPAVVPGDAEASLLVRAVRYQDPDLRMPPDKPLSPSEIARLERWVRMGAPDPRDAATAGTRPENASDPVAGRSHWAFQPLLDRSPPRIDAPEWPRTPIDSFVSQQWERANLQPVSDADRRILLRRLYLRLIGLPPTPTEVTEFLQDQRPDAYGRRVERLLSSPHFGERWGRHWLDLARYADSNGLDENFLFREAWRYRNWVIDAVNEDRPFDRFVMDQIAGDLLPYDSLEQRDQQRIAAGFLVVGPKVLLGNDEKNQRMEVADEQIDTIGRAILGQTLGCARCHDHKFDPVPTADYYALAGILTSTRVMERRHMLGQQRVMEQLVGLGVGGEELDEAYEKYWRDVPELKEKRKHAQSAVPLLEKEDASALEALVKSQPGALAAGALDPRQTKEQRIQTQKEFVAQLDQAIANPPQIPPRAMIPADGPTPADESIRLAGQFDRLGDKVPRGFLRVLCETSVDIPAGQSGRRELGRWLTDCHDGAGPLAARVLANRIWLHLIGSGLVRTVDNFGRTGELPSHPELLDYLAGELIRSQWSIKDLVRQIVMSRTFTLSSRHDDAGQAIDPDNRLLWRAHRKRLDPEALRDSMLYVAGDLDLRPMHSSVWYLGDQATAVGDNKIRRRTDFPCRSVYLPVIRNDLPEWFEAFDFANPHSTTGARPETTVATQGLFLLNDESVMAGAEALARSLLDQQFAGGEQSLVDRLCEQVLNQPPADEERAEMLSFAHEFERQFAADGEVEAKLKAWSMVCHALLVSSRFQILE